MLLTGLAGFKAQPVDPIYGMEGAASDAAAQVSPTQINTAQINTAQILAVLGVMAGEWRGEVRQRIPGAQSWTVSGERSTCSLIQPEMLECSFISEGSRERSVGRLIYNGEGTFSQETLDASRNVVSRRTTRITGFGYDSARNWWMTVTFSFRDGGQTVEVQNPMVFMDGVGTDQFAYRIKGGGRPWSYYYQVTTRRAGD